VLASLAFASMAEDLDHRVRWFRRLLPHRPTYNVVAEAGDRDAQRTVLVVAHHDAAHGGVFFDTRGLKALSRRFPGPYARITRWPPLMWLVAAGPLLIALGRRRTGTILSAGAIGGMLDIGLRPVVPGANDNLAAVAAVLALARRLRDEPVRGIRVLLVSTGSEESNSEGMVAFGRRHFASLPRETTSVIALECLGSGNLTIAETEGFLVPHAFDAGMKDVLSEAARDRGHDASRGFHNSFTSDGQVAMHAGYPTALLGALDEFKLPGEYHKPTDTPENVDFTCVARAVDVLDAAVRRLAAVQA
jgi:Iap family predicted aminopeptidase